MYLMRLLQQQLLLPLNLSLHGHTGLSCVASLDQSTSLVAYTASPLAHGH